MFSLIFFLFQGSGSQKKRRVIFTRLSGNIYLQQKLLHVSNIYSDILGNFLFLPMVWE